MVSFSQFVLDGFKSVSLCFLNERNKEALHRIATEVFLRNNVIAYLLVEILSQKSSIHNIFDISLKIFILLHSHLDIVYSNYAFLIIDQAFIEYQKEHGELMTPERKQNLYQKAVGANKFIFILFSTSLSMFVTFLIAFQRLDPVGLILLGTPPMISAIDNLKKLMLAHWRIESFAFPPIQESNPRFFIPEGFFFQQFCDILMLVSLLLLI